jgi:hypothetical protein
MKSLDAERGRLMNFKTSKVDLLKELEARVKKYDLDDKIDTMKLVTQLRNKDLQLIEVQGIKEIFNTRIEASEKRRETDVKRLISTVVMEQSRTQSAVDKLEQIKLELKMLETNDSSAGSIWKKKCVDMFEICLSMKGENDELRSRCKELITQGIALAETVTAEQNKVEMLPSMPSSTLHSAHNHHRTIEDRKLSSSGQARSIYMK